MASVKPGKKNAGAAAKAAVFPDRKPCQTLPQKSIVAGICAVLILACVIIYGQTLSHGFVNYDDGQYVTDNPQVRAGLSLKTIGWAFVTDKAMYFHPLTWMSHALDCSLYGMHPWGHHLTNLLFHAAASVLLFLALRLLTGALWPSAAVAALFAVHPLHVESVAWIAERKDVLSAFFWMLALGAYGLYARRGGAVRYAAVAAAFVLGLMSKPMVVTLPFVLLLLDYWPLGRIDRAAPFGAMARKTVRLAVEKIPLFLITALSCVSTIVMQTRGNNLAFGEKVNFAGRCANAVVVYVLYLVKTAWPSGLAVFYPHPIARPAWQVAGAAAALAAITLFCLRHARRYPYLIVGWLWYLGTLMPVIELVQAGDFSHADRYTYIPSIGVFIMVAWGGADLAAARHAPKRAVALITGAALALLVLCAGIQAGYWRDNRTLFSHAIDVGQESCIAFTNLGQDALDHKRYDEAREYLTKALGLDPGYVNALCSVGVCALDQGRNDDARACLMKALNLKPDDPNVLNNLGVLAINEGRCDEAESFLKKALDRQPDFADALSNRARAALQQGNYDRASECLTRLLEVKPDHVHALADMGGIAVYQKRYRDAETFLKKALELDPKSVPALHNLGMCFMNLEKHAEAQGCFRKALEIDPKNVSAMKNLAVVLARLGRTEEAAVCLRRALELEQARTNEKR